MKKLLFAFTALFAQLQMFAIPQFGDFGGSTSLANIPKSTLERLAFDGLDNYEDEYMGSSRKKGGIFTITLTNSDTVQRSFYLHNGDSWLESLLTGLRVSSLAVVGSNTTATAAAANISRGLVINGNFTAINDLANTQSLVASGAPIGIQRLHSWIYGNPNCKLNGMVLTSEEALNHSGKILFGVRTPFKSADDVDQPINIRSFRNPKDFDQKISIVKINKNLNRDNYVEMTIAPSSSMSMELYFNMDLNG